MEADLQRFYGIDYRDRWLRSGRIVPDTTRVRGDLTLRRVWVLVRHLPDDSAVADIHRGHKPRWSLEAHLLDDLRMVWTGTEKKPATPHPQRPKPDTTRKDSPERRRKIADARRRQKERRERFAAEKDGR